MVALNYQKCPFAGYTTWITTDNTTCYSFFKNYDNHVDWYRAEEKCQSNGTHLISIHDENLNNFLVNYTISDSSSTMYWIGLSSLENRGVYKWTDGTTYNYTNLKQSSTTSNPAMIYGDGRCVAISIKTGAWNNIVCNEENYFICKKINFNNITTTTLPSTQPPPGNVKIILLSLIVTKGIMLFH